MNGIIRNSKISLNLLVTKARYYRSLAKNQYSTKPSIFQKGSSSLIENIFRRAKSLILSMPDVIIYNPLLGLFYWLGCKSLDLIIQIKTKNITLEINDFRDELPHCFELENPSELPLVSVVIPVHNKFEYTFKSIYSIFKNTQGVDYEIIIADDNSSDGTLNIKEKIKNVILIRNTQGLGFLGNCNLAAKSAKGEFLLFLNNDTVVAPDWMSSLLRTFENDKNIGIVGSKLVYPTGVLQEAGSVTFKDGNCWNYGKFSRPDNPEVNYIKEVDYVSGASLMIRKILWDRIGGFDIRYSPAYYEDADLAFSVRHLGYKVVYQPKSVVVHYEGVSHGNDTSSGIKKHQISNRIKFLEKWKVVLEADQFHDQSELFLARDRSKNNKLVLFIDFSLPTFDQDAGSRMTFQYLKLLVSLGHKVKFLADNYIAIEPYTSILQQMGIEVLYGNDFQINWKSWIKTNGRHFSCVILNRPNVAIKYIDIIRENTECPILYFGHDLHFLRIMRKYELLGKTSLINEFKRWRDSEQEILSKVDIGFYPSFTEPETVKKEFNLSNTAVLPINAYEKTTGSSLLEFDGSKKDLLFVGGFQHDPNIDAVNWFVSEIFSIVHNSLPDVKLHIVGSKTPESIKSLASDKIIIHGYVNDEELTTIYDSCKVVIAPIRYGAGVKGKIIEALYYRCPVITTTVGVEGIDNSRSLIRLADDSVTFAECLISLYENDQLCKKIFDEAPNFIRENYSEQMAVKVIESYLR